MRITSDQLQAIEKSIGHEAKVSIICEHESYRYGMNLQADALADGQHGI